MVGLIASQLAKLATVPTLESHKNTENIKVELTTYILNACSWY